MQRRSIESCDTHRYLVSMRSAAIPGRTDLRRSPGVIGRVGRPADLWQRLAAVVVRSTAARKAMGVPPVQQAAAVGVPASYGMQPLQEVRLRRRQHAV
jgi:hypothetical protein